MNVEEALYKVGELVESAGRALKKSLNPQPQENPPTFKFLKKLVRRKVTIHEMLSLKLQLSFIAYLILALLIVVFTQSEVYLLSITVIFALYLRALLIRNQSFFIEYEPYRTFYYGLTSIAFVSFLGYLILRKIAVNIYYLYAYLIAIFALVLAFRHLFRAKYKRDWTYGVVEEVRGELVKVSVHDDIRANIKPGEYWIDKSEEVEVGSVVKVLVEERTLKGAVPKKIMEVYKTKPSSSNSSTEPKEESESNISL
ncbi:hypothetical protein PAP_00700 [Palaeococcus pacificus DY20341]|uniref:DUF2101 domain-containing protein n=1 Tax=Palaeococcus pacificus DY20341 TaxID=1343739 RepID=A0A075LVW7_9EURY|nr:DUF2101 family protein [Palaeococcus pacificus]AIF68583.1 hypothetical protein PAP_00700 [Palaeococcus pacificus DY20341]